MNAHFFVFLSATTTPTLLPRRSTPTTTGQQQVSVRRKHQAPRTMQKTSLLTKLKTTAIALKRQHSLVKTVVQKSRARKTKALHCQQEVLNHSTKLSIQESDLEALTLALDQNMKDTTSKLSEYNQIDSKQSELFTSRSTFLHNCKKLEVVVHVHSPQST